MKYSLLFRTLIENFLVPIVRYDGQCVCQIILMVLVLLFQIRLILSLTRMKPRVVLTQLKSFKSLIGLAESQLVTRKNQNTHDWSNEKPYECGLETLKGEQGFYLHMVDFCQFYLSVTALIDEQQLCQDLREYFDFIC